MAGREYFLKQAETCLRLAESLGDGQGEVSQRLRAMAAEFHAKARDAERDASKDTTDGQEQ